MPRDGNGNYGLPAGNPVLSNTLITSSWANDTMNDLANEMQDSLSRSGKGGLTAPLGVVDFSGSTPGLHFTSEPTTGLKRETTEDVRVQVTTTDVLRCTKTGVQVLSGGSLKNPVVEETGQKVMRGIPNDTVLFMYVDTPPLDWVLKEPDANVRELVIGPSGSGQGGTFGGSVDPNNLVQTATVTVSSISGTADLGGGVPGGIPFSGTTDTPAGSTQTDITSGVTISTSAHTHTFSGTTDAVANHTHTVSGTGSGTADVNITPRYARGILVTLGP